MPIEFVGTASLNEPALQSLSHNSLGVRTEILSKHPLKVKRCTGLFKHGKATGKSSDNSDDRPRPRLNSDRSEWILFCVRPRSCK
jgi:hypothetical protein